MNTSSHYKLKYFIPWTRRNIYRILAINLTVIILYEFVDWKWIAIPWVPIALITSLEQVGESTENPFEENANDIPITSMSRTIEIDLREMLDEKEIPPPIQPINSILM